MSYKIADHHPLLSRQSCTTHSHELHTHPHPQKFMLFKRFYAKGVNNLTEWTIPNPSHPGTIGFPIAFNTWSSKATSTIRIGLMVIRTTTCPGVGLGTSFVTSSIFWPLKTIALAINSSLHSLCPYYKKNANLAQVTILNWPCLIFDNEINLVSLISIYINKITKHLCLSDIWQVL